MTEEKDTVSCRKKKDNGVSAQTTGQIKTLLQATICLTILQPTYTHSKRFTPHTTIRHALPLPCVKRPAYRTATTHTNTARHTATRHASQPCTNSSKQAAGPSLTRAATAHPHNSTSTDSHSAALCYRLPLPGTTATTSPQPTPSPRSSTNTWANNHGSKRTYYRTQTAEHTRT